MIFDLEPRKIGPVEIGHKAGKELSALPEGDSRRVILLDKKHPSGDDSEIGAGVWLYGIATNPFIVLLNETFPGVFNRVTEVVGYQINNDPHTRNKFLYVPPVPLRGLTTF